MFMSECSILIHRYRDRASKETIRDWNDFPDSLIFSAEISDDCVSKFASLSSSMTC